MNTFYKTKHNIGPVNGCEGGHLFIGRYPNKEIALIIGDPETDDDYLVATVALDDAPRVSPRHVWLKGWSENTGVPEAMEAAGVVRLVGTRHATGFVAAELAEVLPPLAEDIAAYLAEQGDHQ